MKSKNVTQKVFAYRNLNRKGVVWSIKDCKTNLVIDRTGIAYFQNVELKVSQAGRARVLKQRTKNVHAGVCGERIVNEPLNTDWIRATYNPYLAETFVTESGVPILKVKYAKLTQDGLFVSMY